MMKHFSLFYISALLLFISCSGREADKNPVDKDGKENVVVKDQESQKLSDWKIHKKGVGPIELGDSISGIFKYQKFFIEEQPVSNYGIDDNHTGYLMLKDGEPLLFIAPQHNAPIIWGITILSPEYKTEEGIKVGMSVDSLKEKFTDLKLWKSMMSGQEYFAPDKFQTYRNGEPYIVFTLNVSAVDGENLGVYQNDTEPTSQYNTRGKVESIQLFYFH